MNFFCNDCFFCQKFVLILFHIFIAARVKYMAKFRKTIEDLKRKLSQWGKVFFIFGLSQLGVGCKEKVAEPQKPAKVAVVPPKPIVKNPVGSSTYVVDTLDSPRGGVLLFCSGKSIVRYFVENNDRYRMRLYLFVHEQKHKDNYLKGLRSVKVSPAQYAKICMHDEISANIAALLTLRYEYLTADDKESVIKKYENSEYDYYFRALKAGKIFPEKEDKVNRDAEWSFIMNETRDMWMRRYAPVYQPSVWRMVERYTRRMDDKISSSMLEKYYQKGLRIAYNIGGVDFSKYMDKDIEPQDKNFSLLDQVVSLKIFKNKQDEAFKSVQKQIKNFEDEDVPITYELVSQIYFAEAIKSALADISAKEIENNPEIVNVYFNKIYTTFTGNEDFHKLVFATADNSYRFSSLMRKSTSDLSSRIYEKIYAFKGLALNKMISALPQDIYHPYFGLGGNGRLQSREFAATIFLDFQLEQMRLNSKEPPSVKRGAIQSEEKSRKSDTQVIALPDFTQPILVASTQDDMLEIKKCIDDFYNIPYEMRHCDLKAQQKFLKTQEKAQKVKRQDISVRRGHTGRE